MNDAIETNHSGGWIGTLLVRAVVPAYLLFGAAMKWHSATPESLPRWIIARLEDAFSLTEEYEAKVTTLKIVIAIEILSALLMIFVSRLARPVALVMLALLTIVATVEAIHHGKAHEGSFLHKLFAGDCGCFGTAISIPAGVIALVDFGLFISIQCFRPRTRPWRDTPKWSLAGVALGAVVGITLALNLEMKGIHASEEELAKYKPHYWVGWTFEETALPEWLDNSADLSTYGGGRQTWILYRKTCPTCHDLFDNHYSGDTLDHTVVAILVAPTSREVVPEGTEDVTCPACQFLEIPPETVEKYHGEIPTPTVIEFGADGKVMLVSNPLFHGQPQVGAEGDYEHGTEEMREDWGDILKGEELEEQMRREQREREAEEREEGDGEVERSGGGRI